MPTHSELILNKALSGPDLAQVIENDLHRILSSNGYLSPHVAYQRVAYDIRVTLHLGNPSVPAPVVERVTSHSASQQQVAESPGLAALEGPPPLVTPPPDSIVSSDALHRDITSPNLVRIEHDLPVEILTRDNDGHVQERRVAGKSWEGTDGAGYEVPGIEDLSEEARKELGLA
jgi:hypothetical protein